MTRRYAFDAVVLSNFALADALDVVQRQYAGRGVVPAEVWDETAAGVAHGLNALQRVDDLIATRAFSIVSLTAPERARYRELRRSLGSGEAACIAWSQARGATVVTDDRRARVAAVYRDHRDPGRVGQGWGVDHRPRRRAAPTNEDRRLLLSDRPAGRPPLAATEPCEAAANSLRAM